MNTLKEIVTDHHKSRSDDEQLLVNKQNELLSTLQKLQTLGAKLEKQSKQGNAKARETLLRQRHSYKQLSAQLNEIETAIRQKSIQIGEEVDACIVIRGTLHPNTVAASGKYQKITENPRKNVQIMYNCGWKTTKL